MQANLASTTGARGSAGHQPSALEQAGQEAKQQAGGLAQRGREVGVQQANTQKDRAAEKLDHLAGAIQRVETDVQKQDPGIAKAANIAAQQTERLASYLRSTDTNEMLSKVEDLARHKPAVFLGGAFAVGLALSRLAKASSTQEGGQQAGGAGLTRTPGG